MTAFQDYGTPSKHMTTFRASVIKKTDKQTSNYDYNTYKKENIGG